MGLFDRQRLYGGKRLQEEFEQSEPFVLWDLAVVAEGMRLPDESGKVDKVELIVSRNEQDPFVVSTLSGPIRDLAYANVRDKKGKPKADDLPCVAHWEVVETKRSREAKSKGGQGFNDAVVLVMESPYTGPARDLPAFTFTPITEEDNPLLEATA